MCRNKPTNADTCFTRTQRAYRNTDTLCSHEHLCTWRLSLERAESPPPSRAPVLCSGALCWRNQDQPPDPSGPWNRTGLGWAGLGWVLERWKSRLPGIQHHYFSWPMWLSVAPNLGQKGVSQQNLLGTPSLPVLSVGITTISGVEKGPWAGCILQPPTLWEPVLGPFAHHRLLCGTAGRPAFLLAAGGV